MLKETANHDLPRTREATREAYDPVAALKALGHPLRYAMFELLSGGEKCVCEVVDAMDASQPLVSHHLRVLKRAGLITDRHDATWVYYRVNAESWEGFLQAMGSLRPSPASSAPCPPENSLQEAGA